MLTLFKLTKTPFWLSLKTLPKNPFSLSISDRIKLEKQERYKANLQAMPLKSKDDLTKIRNIGIIAHIDAGKTTITERMLFYSGALDHPGEVHDGNTVMDYMEQERQRGITIRSAAITFQWNDVQFNLIDTPGHIDFTGEVERSLKVLDGAIAIFDAVQGVQTQSQMVWLQSNKYNVPRIAFINKMDRMGANFQLTVESIQQKLNVVPFLTQIPIGEENNFQGVIDLISMKKYIFSDKFGVNVIIEDLDEKDAQNYERALYYKEKLIDNVTLFDDEIANLVVSGEKLEPERLKQSLKQIISENAQKSAIILVGSALKNKGIQPLLEAVIDYLPSPSEKKPVVCQENQYLTRKPLRSEKLCSYVYKIIHDPLKGDLTYVRVYSGVLHAKQQIRNALTGNIEKGTNLFRVRASDYVSINEITCGDIAAIAGLKHTQSGDTLICTDDKEKFILEKLTLPQAVFLASLEYESLRDKTKLEEALKSMTREDNTISFKEDQETGQIVVAGLGELHLEVLVDRLKSEHGISTNLAKMRVAYREAVSQQVQERKRIIRASKSGKQSFFEIELQLTVNEEVPENSDGREISLENNNQLVFGYSRNFEFDRYYEQYKKQQAHKKEKKRTSFDLPDETQESVKEKELKQIIQQTDLSYLSQKLIKNPMEPKVVDVIEIDGEEEEILGIESMPLEYFQTIENTLRNSLQSGSIRSFPLINTRITILGGAYSNKKTDQTIIEIVTAELMNSLKKGAKCVLMEPFVKIEISSLNEYSSDIMNNVLSHRRGKIEEIADEKSNFGLNVSDRNKIFAQMPVSETIGYTTYLRSISKGEASFIMKFDCYQQVQGGKLKELIEKNEV